MHISSKILVILIIESIFGEEYQQDNLDYSNENSADSGSNEINNSIDNYNNNNTVTITIPKEVTEAPVNPYNTFNDSKHPTDDMINFEVTSIDTEDASPATPKFSLKDCQDDHYHAPSRSAEDRCSSTLVNYPFSVSIQKKGAHYASGALVDKRWILTVAGEFFYVRESIKLFRARLGSVDCKRDGSLVPLKRVELHPSYVYGTPNFDLALLRMAKPVDYTDYIKPIGLSNINARVISAKFITTYWPRLIVKGEVLPSSAKERVKQNSMRVSTQHLIPWDKCSSLIHDPNVTLDESTLCLKPVVTHHSMCMPDAGAPVVAEDGLWGITSGWTSEDCRLHHSPTVFSRLSSAIVRSWLDSQFISI